MATTLTPELVAEYTAAGYWSDKTFGDYAEEMVRKCHDRDLVVDGDKRFSFGQINDMDIIPLGINIFFCLRVPTVDLMTKM